MMSSLKRFLVITSMSLAALVSFQNAVCSADDSSGRRYDAGANLPEPMAKRSNNFLANLAHAGLSWRARISRSLWTDVDALGYPVSIPDDGLYSLVINQDHPAGTYVLEWDGTAELRLDGPNENAGIELLESAPNRRVYAIKPASYMGIILASQDPQDRVRNIRLWLPGMEHAGSLWNPDWLDFAAKMRVLRFARLAPERIRPELPDNGWAQPGQYSFARVFRDWPHVGEGLPVSWCSDFINRTGVVPWICIPDGLIDEAGLRALAEAYAASLEGEGLVYAELGNDYLARFGREDPAVTPAAAVDYVALSQRLAHVWREVFGSRLRVVLVIEESSPAHLQALDDALNALPEARADFDYLAITPYYGLGLGALLPSPMEGVTADDLFDVIETRQRPQVAADIHKAANLARKHGLGLISASGGQHISLYRGEVKPEDRDHFGELIAATARHPRMETLYRQYLEDWQAAGGGFQIFTDLISEAHSVGQWGLKETFLQADADAPKLRALAEPRARIVTIKPIVTGLRFTEGPVWLPDGSLVFSDLQELREYRWTPTEGLSVRREPSNKANGHALDPQGRLITCEDGARRVIREEPDGSITVLADSFDGVQLNAPNDVVVHPNGTIFFTDPNFGRKDGGDRQFIYRLPTDGPLEKAVEGSWNKPNGIGLSPDGRTLYVNIGSDHKTLAWPLDEQARVSGDSRVIAEGFDRGTDGMTVHPRTGDLFIAVFHNQRRQPDEQGIHVYSPAGEFKGMIPIPGTTTNCTFSPDGDTLWVTSGGAVYRVDLGPRYNGEPVRVP